MGSWLNLGKYRGLFCKFAIIPELKQIGILLGKGLLMWHCHIGKLDEVAGLCGAEVADLVTWNKWTHVST